MNVRVSDEFERQAKSDGRTLYPSLKKVIRILENLRSENLSSQKMIRRLADTSEDIYVLRYRGLRFFLTIRENDALLIGFKKYAGPQIHVSSERRSKFAVNGRPVYGFGLHIIWYIIVGFIVGLIARAIMPGVQHLGLILTTVLGIAGSIVGGLIGRLFSKPEPGLAFQPAGFILSIIGAIILLFIWGRLTT
jgi:uncharacterized membrane protein YeaQ/YmgE (transglycosylase-associated protein family)